jgi:hypothetical protein
MEKHINLREGPQAVPTRPSGKVKFGEEVRRWKVKEVEKKSGARREVEQGKMRSIKNRNSDIKP